MSFLFVALLQEALNPKLPYMIQPLLKKERRISAEQLLLLTGEFVFLLNCIHSARVWDFKSSLQGEVVILTPRSGIAEVEKTKLSLPPIVMMLS